MATRTFTNDDTFVVPDDNSSVTIRCYGGKGEDGIASSDDTSSTNDARHSASNGSNGGYAEGTLSVTPGEPIHVRIGGGGSGQSGGATYGGAYASATSGRGGHCASVRYNGTNVSDTRIGAGGGGGGAAVGTVGSDGSGANTSGSGAGGGEGQDGGEEPDTDAAIGGASGSFFGESGDRYKRDRGGVGVSIACGGGGGGGIYGGEGGDRDIDTFVSSNSDSTGIFGSANGGAGGDGNVSGVSNTTVTVGGHAGTAKVEIDYTPTPNAPIAVNAEANHQAPNVEVTWDINDSITDGFYIYRSETAGFTPGSGNRIATLGSGGTRSYTDSTVERGVEYFYRVSAFESTSGNESDASTDVSSLAGEVVKVLENGTYTKYPIKYLDATSSAWEFASELWIYLGDDAYSTSAYGTSPYGGSSASWEAQ